jgi:hypothetical protein
MFVACTQNIYSYYLLFLKKYGVEGLPYAGAASETQPPPPPENKIVNGILRVEKCWKRDEISRKCVIKTHYISEACGCNS